MTLLEWPVTGGMADKALAKTAVSFKASMQSRHAPQWRGIHQS
jgi:hypothetical protein